MNQPRRDVAAESRTVRTERAEICIVGTGAAGGILAWRLAESGRDVLSLEQGASIRDADFTNHLTPTIDLHYGIAPNRPWPVAPPDAYFYENTFANSLYARNDVSSTTSDSERTFKNRQIFRLNGKQNLWGGVSLRYSRRDFRALDYGEGIVNWPIDYDDLEPHYTAVEKTIGVCGSKEGLEELPDGEFLPPMPLRPADQLLVESVGKIRNARIRAIPNRKAVETRPDAPNVCGQCGLCTYGCSTGSVYKFSSRLLPRIEKLPNYRIRYETKVLRLRRSANDARIEAAECLDTATGERFDVVADTFIVAAGALETPRLLFNSADEQFPEGLGNRSGFVGRYLQDNVKVMSGGVLRKMFGYKANYPAGFGDHLLIPRFLFDNQDFYGGYQAQYVHTLPYRPFYLSELGFAPPRLKDRFARRLFCSYVGLLFFGKPEIRADNRLVLSDRDRDIWGVPQVKVHYQWGENDRRMQESMKKWGKIILKKASALTVSTFSDDIPGNGIHYAGTCRMAASNKEGVVDRDCRTFDHPNLYLCDGSVTPDINEKNLTLTLMALAHRLAEHLATT